MKNYKAFLIFVSLVLAISALFLPAQEEKPKTIPEQVDGVFSEMDRPHTPGAAAAIIKDGSVVYLEGYGLASLEHSLPVTPKTVFDMASVAKQFTGMAVAMLAEQGKLSLDDDVRKHIPEMPDFGKTITLDHLVHHTSGIRDWPEALVVAGWDFADVISFQQILKMVQHQKELNFPPGSQYLYSNTNYNLLAEVVKRVTGQSFRDWTWENILKPLRMAKTRFQENHREIIPNKASSYSFDRTEGYLKVSSNLTAYGSSSLYSTAEDMAKWMLNFDNCKVGGKEVIEKMFTKGKLNNGKEIDYGFGLAIGAYKGLKKISHTGSWAGFLSAVHYYPEQRFGVTVMCNLTGYGLYNPENMANRITDIFLKEHFREEKKEQPLAAGEVKVKAKILAQYEGRYQLDYETVLTITRDEERLFLETSSKRKYVLVPQSENKFFLQVADAYITFQKNKAGKVKEFLFQRGKGKQTARRINEKKPGLKELQAFTGVYYNEELDARYNIILRDGKLVARHRRHNDITLKPVDKDNFSGSVWFFSEVIFLRDQKGRVSGFKISGSRAKNIIFKKRTAGVGDPGL